MKESLGKYLRRYAMAPMVGRDGPRKELIIEDLERLGLECEEDDIGNIYVFNTKEPKPVIVDAHMDSIPFGAVEGTFWRSVDIYEELGEEVLFYTGDGYKEVLLEDVEEKGYLSPLQYDFSISKGKAKGLLDNAIGCAILTTLLEEGAPIIAVYSVAEEQLDGGLIDLGGGSGWGRGAGEAVKRLSKLKPSVAVTLDVVGVPEGRAGTIVREVDEGRSRKGVYSEAIERLAIREKVGIDWEEHLAREMWEEGEAVSPLLIGHDNANIYSRSFPSISIMVALQGDEHDVDAEARMVDIGKTYRLAKAFVEKVS